MTMSVPATILRLKIQASGAILSFQCVIGCISLYQFHLLYQCVTGFIFWYQFDVVYQFVGLFSVSRVVQCVTVLKSCSESLLFCTLVMFGTQVV